jgi:hypothetical protein
LLTESDENSRESFRENGKWKTPNENECVISQPDNKNSVMIHQMITPNEKKNVITQPEDNSGRNVKNIIIQPKDNMLVIIQQDDITKR